MVLPKIGEDSMRLLSVRRRAITHGVVNCRILESSETVVYVAPR
jgi:hypothetical protein